MFGATASKSMLLGWTAAADVDIYDRTALISEMPEAGRWTSGLPTYRPSVGLHIAQMRAPASAVAVRDRFGLGIRLWARGLRECRSSDAPQVSTHQSRVRSHADQQYDRRSWPELHLHEIKR